MPPTPRSTAAAIAAAVAVTLAGAAASLRVAAADHQSLPGSALNIAVVLCFAAVGAVVAAARPANRVGWLMLVGGTLWSAGGAGVDLARHALVAAPGSLPGGSAFAVAGELARSLSWCLLTAALPLCFPDGTITGKGARWARRALLLVLAGAVVDPIMDASADLRGFGSWHNPLAPPGAWRLVSGLAFLLHIPLGAVLTVGAAVMLAARWRRGTPALRQQISLFAAAAALPVVAAPIALTVGGGSWIFGATALPLPFAIGFAVLTRGLYDLRSATNRALVWVILSAGVVGIYAVVIAGAGGVLHVGRGAVWLPWLAAAVVALSFAPLRDTLQRGVNRLTYGRWDEPYAVLAALGRQLEATADVDGLLDALARELHGLGLEDVAVCDAYGERVAAGPGPGTPEEARSSAVPARRTVELPVSAYGTAVGILRFHSPQAQLRCRDQQLLDDLCGHLGGVLHARRLTAELERARERLVLAREEERRRLRRDLHDGLGPALAGHLLRVEIVEGMLPVDTAARAEVEVLRQDLRATVLEVRRVVEGLRPPALDELGLAGTLDQVARRLTRGTGLQVTLDVGELPPLPAAMEVAAFRIVTEAVTNVVRHAQAQRCRASVAVVDARLRLEVTDDGRGLGGARGDGHGLHTMRERAEELRGHLLLSSQDGTTVVAEIPLPRLRVTHSNDKAAPS